MRQIALLARLQRPVLRVRPSCIVAVLVLVAGLTAAVLARSTVAAHLQASDGIAGRAFRIDGSPQLTATATFRIPALRGVHRSFLRLFAESGSSSGYKAVAGTKSAVSRPFRTNAWTQVDVSSLTAGRALVTIRIEDRNSTAIRFAGDASANPPELRFVSGARVVAEVTPTGVKCGSAAGCGSSTTTTASTDQGQLVGGRTALIAAAGDIACDPSDSAFAHPEAGRCQERATSNLLLGLPHLAALLPLGDDQYECGRAAAYSQSYGPTWGRLLKITHPVPGNHEYGRPCHLNDPSPYFSYFGHAAGPAGKGWYSYDIARWHLIALDSECGYGTGATAVGGCGPGSPQERWLRQDLATHHNVCTLAYWHEPRFSSGEHGDAASMSTIWNDLVRAHTDVVLSGHNHDYERFTTLGATPAPAAAAHATTTGAPVYQQPNLDPSGISEFVVGTGGKNLYKFEASKSQTINPPLLGELFRNDTVFGVLELTLLPRAFSWRFVTTAHAVLDRGTSVCH